MAPVTVRTHVFRICRQFWWARYAVLTIASPLLIVVAAQRMPNVLRGLLLLQMEQDDLGWLTWMSAMVVALGLAIYRIIDLHGEVRMGSVSAAETDSRAAEGVQRRFSMLWRKDSVGWPLLPTVIWLAVSLSFPIAAARETIGDMRANGGGQVDVPGLWQSAILEIGAGMLCAALSLFVLSLTRTVIVGGRSAGSGLFYGEGMAHWLVSRMRSLASQRKPLIVFPMHLDGLTDPATKKLLPGHMQLLIALIASSAVYVTWYLRSMSDATWQPHGWPIGFYLLLLIYCSSALFSFLTFVLDRYRIPMALAAIAYVAMVSDAHRFFELTAGDDVADLSSIPADSDHLLIQALAQRRSQGKYAEPPHLADLYGLEQGDFVLPVWPDGKRTLVVVTASGGGIQAAGWTARVLTGLERRFPVMAESIGLISSVSGGSVGVMHYLAHRRPRGNDPDAVSWPSIDEDVLETINEHSTASSLEAVGWGLAFPDFARTVSPFPLSQRVDRGWALEASWWNRIGPNPESAKWMKEVRIRDLIQPIREGKFPPVIFNSTAVETGQRVLISPVRATAHKPASPIDYTRINSPIDFLDFYGGALNTPEEVNPRLTTAVRLSAAFAYVTPVARPLKVDPSMIRAGHGDRLEMHLCDGGYADNTGLVSAIRIIQDLVTHYHQQMEDDESFEPPFERVIFVRIEPFPASAAKIVRDKSGLNGALLGPITALMATRTSTQAERADLELSLLMDMSASEFSDAQQRLALDLELRMKKELKEVFEQVKLEGQELARLQGVVEGLKSMGFNPQSKKERIDLERQIRRVQVELKRPGLPEAPDAKRIAEAIQAYNEARELNSRQPRKRIEIKTALFRFDTRAKPASGVPDPSANATALDESLDGEESYHPPLSWRLAQSDIAALDTAWDLYDRAFNQASVATASSDRETPETPWQTSNAALRDATLHPSAFQKMTKE